jgi:choline kinase
MSSRYAFILAGGVGSRLCLLSERRAKPAVPFGGKYRIIDFTLSNCVNSGIFDVGVLTQYRPTSLNQHIGIGRPWDLDRTRGGIQLLQPAPGLSASDWYQGTADAIYQNIVHLKRRRNDEVLILSGDHIYQMDYNVLYAFHRRNGASLTVAVTEVPEAEVSQFGILETEPQGRVTAFKEKPKGAVQGRLASMGVYLFDREALIRWLVEDAALEESFARLRQGPAATARRARRARLRLPVPRLLAGRRHAGLVLPREPRVRSARAAARPERPRVGAPHADRRPAAGARRERRARGAQPARERLLGAGQGRELDPVPGRGGGARRGGARQHRHARHRRRRRGDRGPGHPRQRGPRRARVAGGARRRHGPEPGLSRAPLERPGRGRKASPAARGAHGGPQCAHRGERERRGLHRTRPAGGVVDGPESMH